MPVEKVRLRAPFWAFLSNIDRTAVKLEQMRYPAAGFFRLQEELMDVSSDCMLNMKHKASTLSQYPNFKKSSLNEPFNESFWNSFLCKVSASSLTQIKT